jgi:cobalt/nickel transport protein
MKDFRAKVIMVLFFVTVFLLGSIISVSAHFGMIIPSDDMITQEDSKNIALTVQFIHPMEGDYMNMAKPVQFGVKVQGKKIDLLNTLQEKKINDCTTWEANYQIKRPGDHIFYVEPQPYWEPAEDCFIIHYTKVIVNALGLEVGWDEEVGLKTEIIPLTRPYGLWTGNVFQGIVKVEGEAVPYAEVEVEYYNQDGQIKCPAGPMITQVIKADQNGVFTYAMPKAGWWGFAALNEDREKIKYEEEEKSVEIGAVLWVKTYNME